LGNTCNHSVQNPSPISQNAKIEIYETIVSVVDVCVVTPCGFVGRNINVSEKYTVSDVTIQKNNIDIFTAARTSILSYDFTCCVYV
jgi:hypothetical protein